MPRTRETRQRDGGEMGERRGRVGAENEGDQAERRGRDGGESGESRGRVGAENEGDRPERRREVRTCRYS